MTLLAVQDLRIHYRVPGDWPWRAHALKAVDGVSFELDAGETLGVVGESGCGKSTLARGILGLVPPTAGTITVEGRPLGSLDRRALRAQRALAGVVLIGLGIATALSGSERQR